jgi:hypothetical protein
VSWSDITGIPAGFADGVDNGVMYTEGAGLSLNGANEFSVNFGGAGSANSAARSDHDHFSANWSGASSGYGLVVVNNSTAGTGLYSQQGSGSGQAAPFGYKAAVWGESSHGDALYGATGSSFGAGVYGYATALSGGNYGVYGQTDSTNGVGVFARGSGTTGTALKISNGAFRVAGAGVNTAAPVFIHKVTTNNLVYLFSLNPIWTVIDNPYCNDAPDAILLVTPNYGRIFDGTPTPAPVMAIYDEAIFGKGRWFLQSMNNTLLEEGQRYNVMVIRP